MGGLQYLILVKWYYLDPKLVIRVGNAIEGVVITERAPRSFIYGPLALQ